jgi:23S rRNA (adenine1618-N6)-methyltransferase
MPPKKKQQTQLKPRLHARSKHRERYDFKELVKGTPELASFVVMNKYNDESIDFANPDAVKMLNKAILQHYYQMTYWDIPEGYLCPPIPGRADYIHHIADILGGSNFGKIPIGKHIVCMDIGVGANCVYPIIGSTEYDWSFIGTDIDQVAIDSASEIVKQNEILKDRVELKLQSTTKDIFYGVLRMEDRIDLSICNPPFHASAEEAKSVSKRKLKNLGGIEFSKPVLNFGGQNNELFCEGGERKFIHNMIRESKNFAESCFWFSSLVSKQSNLKSIELSLKEANVHDVRVIPMGQGNKSSRLVAWTFLDSNQQKTWRESRWQLK